MIEVNLIVNDQEIELAEPVTIVSGSENVYLCKFTFTEEWTGFEKTAVFLSRTDAREVYVSNNQCTIPWEALEIDDIRRQELKIGVYGVKNDVRMPTVYTKPLTVHPGAETAEGGGTPTPTQWEQILSMLADGTIYVDATLTTPGKGADAKKVGDRAMLTSNVTIDSGNYQSYSDANNFAPNRIYGISIGITENMVANLPVYSVRGFLAYFAHYEGYPNGFQLHISSQGLWFRNWTGTDTWNAWKKCLVASDIDTTLAVTGAPADAKTVGDRAVLTSDVTIDYENYADFSDANNYVPNRIYGISSSITSSDMVDNLPAYGERGFLLYYAYYAGYPNGAQIYISQTGMWFRAWLSTDTWSDWKSVITDNDNRILKSSNLVVTATNYQTYGITDVNDIEPNKVYRFASNLTEEMVANLPYYGYVGELIYYISDTGDTYKRGAQIYICKEQMYFRQHIATSQGGSWSPWHKVARENDIFAPTNVTISASNYTSYDIDNLSENRIYGISSGITSEMLPNLPEYSETSFILQFNYYQGTGNNVQIYVNKYRMFWRAYYGNSWSDWNKVQEDFVLYPCKTVVGAGARVSEWENSDVILFGDSITIGSHVSRTWFSYVADEYGCTEHNYAKSGAGFVRLDPDSTGLNLLTQVNNVSNSVWQSSKLVIVAAGTNDASLDYLTASGFRTAVQAVINEIRTHTQVPIIFVTPLHRHFQSMREQLTPYISGAICNIALDNRCFVINGYDFPIAMISNDWVTDMSDMDGLHPNEDGNWAFAQCFMQATK